MENQQQWKWKAGHRLKIHSLDFGIPSHGPKQERKLEVPPKDRHSRWLKYCSSIYLVSELLTVCCLHSWSSQGPAHEVMALCEVSSELVHSSRTSLADSKSLSPAGWGQLGEITVLCVPGDSRPCLGGAWLLSKHSEKHFSCPTELAISTGQRQRGSLKENRSCSCSANHTQ